MATVDHHVGGILVSADMADEIDAHATGSLVVQVAVEAEGAEVALKFAAEQGRGLSASCVPGALGTEED